MEEGLKKTPLNSVHKRLGAKLIGFAGWEMPLQFSGIIDEHLSVRSSAGVFDVSHMGRIEIRGEKAASLVQRLTTNDVAKMGNGQVHYSLLCYPDGGIVDDITVYKIEDDRFMLCANAVNKDKDFSWIRENNKEKADIIDTSDESCQLAVQGEKAEEVLQKLSDTKLSSLGYFCFGTVKIDGVEAIVSRTGYTGEDGFEIYFSHSKAEKIWDAVFEAGERFNIKPVGLGARDTLRIEMKYLLYGNDIDSKTTPLEAGVGWAVKLGKGDFIGKEVLLRQKEKGVTKKLIGFELIDRGIPRSGYPLYDKDVKVGTVTSGIMSPSLKKPVGMGYLDIGYSNIDTVFDVEIRGKRVKAKVVQTPFYKSRVKAGH